MIQRYRVLGRSVAEALRSFVSKLPGQDKGGA